MILQSDRSPSRPDPGKRVSGISTFGHRERWLRSLVGGLIGFALFTMVTHAAAESPTVHPYHVTYTELSFNSKTGNFEVSLCVWPMDLETALQRQESKPIDLEKSKQLDAMMQRYVETRFFVLPQKPTQDDATTAEDQPVQSVEDESSSATDSKKSGSKKFDLKKSDSNASDKPEKPTSKPAKQKIRWIGHEFERRQVWMYFEISGDEKFDLWQVENRMFMELNDDQLNHVQWSLSKRQYETFVCKANQPGHPVSTKRLLRTPKPNQRLSD